MARRQPPGRAAPPLPGPARRPPSLAGLARFRKPLRPVVAGRREGPRVAVDPWQERPGLLQPDSTPPAVAPEGRPPRRAVQFGSQALPWRKDQRRGRTTTAAV